MALVVTMTAGDSRENYKMGTEGSRQCGDRIRASHLWHCHVLLMTPLISGQPQLLVKLSGTSWTLLYLHSPATLTLSPLICWSSTFWREFSQAPSLVLPLRPFPVSLYALKELVMLVGSGVRSVPVIDSPLSPGHHTLPRPHWFPLPARHFHLGVLLSSQTKPA